MVPRIETGLSNLNTQIKTATPVGSPITSPGELGRKSIGDIPPEIVDPGRYPHLAALLTQYGVVSRIRRKLTQLSGKKGWIKLAKNTIGAADHKGIVYLGVDFLDENQNNVALLAGVMAHEWGHLVSSLGRYRFDHLTWDEIFEIRREDEAAADAFCGRNLPLMGYSVEPIVRFLLTGNQRSITQKYYPLSTRAEIILRAAEATRQRQSFAKNLFGSAPYANPYTSVLWVA